MFHKILIANRGEIALRVIAACRDLGVRTVAVYSEADRTALHVRHADEAWCIGPARSADSYLNVPAVISAAEVSNAEAVHPGYGFLAEDARFAEVCELSNIVFIGPSVEAIRMMGDKARARRIMAEAGVPVLPGTAEPLGSLKDARRAGEHIGYPLMLKAANGGGGRGMRMVERPEELDRCFGQAQQEAAASFHNGDLYVEKFIGRPRHIEFQVLGDRHGRVISLGERECSIQRRHQKLIEEAPSRLDAETRERISCMICRALEGIGYSNAGTVEFLMDETGRLFFIEMNARIQVEHPVTEIVTGVDLVTAQIRLAAGEPLSAILPSTIELRGHAIECRVNAENPETFAPSAGKITQYVPPGGIGVRVDSAAYAGWSVPPHYDSLVAKLIASADDRTEALSRLRRALDLFVIEGIHTSIPLHRRICASERFAQGEYDTGFVERLLRQADDSPALASASDAA